MAARPLARIAFCRAEERRLLEAFKLAPVLSLFLVLAPNFRLSPFERSKPKT